MLYDKGQFIKNHIIYILSYSIYNIYVMINKTTKTNNIILSLKYRRQKNILN